MTKIYQDSDLWDAIMQRRRILGIFFAVTGVCFAALVGFVVYYIMLPYNDPNATWVTAVSCVLVGLYLIFVFPYMGISFKRSNAYCKMLKLVSAGRKESAFLPFEGIDDWTTHDGVDVNVAVFSVRNIKRDETMRRQLYVDGEKDYPAFEEGYYVKLVSQGNLLIEYEFTDIKGDNNMRAVVTVTGSDRRGIIAKVSGFLFERNVNIEDISQTVLGEQFAMIMMVDTSESEIDFMSLAQELEDMGKKIGMNVRLQHAAIFDAMHNV